MNSQMAKNKGKNPKSTNQKSVPKPPGQGTSRGARRRRRQSQNGSSSDKTIMTRVSDPIYVATDTGLRRMAMKSRKGLSDAGIQFLKCAFAPPDFTGTSVGGIPDDFRGLSLVKKHRYVQPYTLNSALDVYFLLLPSPGIAYYYAAVAAGAGISSTTVFLAVAYSDFASMFGTSETDAANQVNRFRFISNHIELIPTVNQMTWSGNIQAWKLPIQVVLRPPLPTSTNSADYLTVTGLNGCDTSQANMYTAPFIGGVYSACYSSNPSFDFSSILENISGANIPAVIGASDFGQLSGAVSGSIPGFDNNFESLCIKVSGVSATETMIIKTWACVEYIAVPTSVLYPFSSLSPCDKLAIEMYREIILELPIGVPFEQNETFWKRVLQIINMISNAGAYIPGPVGLASRGVNMLSQAGMSLF